MERVRELFRKFQNSDGRAKAVTASGVLVLAAAVALAVGVLPALGFLGGNPGPEVPGVQVDWGGGSGACDDALVSLEDGTSRGPSAASHELHVQNPRDGEIYEGSDGTRFRLTVYSSDTKVDIEMLDPTGGNVFYDVVINGGKKSFHYDFDLNGIFVSEDDGLMAPEKDNKEGEFHKISHINVCYDLQPTVFECGVETEPVVLSQQPGLFVSVIATTLPNSLFDCDTKQGFFFVDNANEVQGPNTLIDLGDGDEVLAGRAVVTRQFANGPSIATLQYALTLDDTPADMSYCGIRDKFTVDSEGYTEGDPVDGDEFDMWLEDDEYPTLEGVTDGLNLADGAIACRVADLRYANGENVTVVYFEFIDPILY